MKVGRLELYKALSTLYNLSHWYKEEAQNSDTDNKRAGTIRWIKPTLFTQVETTTKNQN